MINEKTIKKLRSLVRDYNTIDLRGPYLAQLACHAGDASHYTDVHACINGTYMDLYEAACLVTGLPEDFFYFDLWPKDYQLLAQKNTIAAALVAITWYLEVAKEIEDGIFV